MCYVSQGVNLFDTCGDCCVSLPNNMYFTQIFYELHLSNFCLSHDHYVIFVLVPLQNKEDKKDGGTKHLS